MQAAAQQREPLRSHTTISVWIMHWGNCFDALGKRAACGQWHHWWLCRLPPSRQACPLQWCPASQSPPTSALPLLAPAGSRIRLEYVLHTLQPPRAAWEALQQVMAAVESAVRALPALASRSRRLRSDVASLAAKLASALSSAASLHPLEPRTVGSGRAAVTTGSPAPSALLRQALHLATSVGKAALLLMEQQGRQHAEQAGQQEQQAEHEEHEDDGSSSEDGGSSIVGRGPSAPQSLAQLNRHAAELGAVCYRSLSKKGPSEHRWAAVSRVACLEVCSICCKECLSASLTPSMPGYSPHPDRALRCLALTAQHTQAALAPALAEQGEAPPAPTSLLDALLGRQEPPAAPTSVSEVLREALEQASSALSALGGGSESSGGSSSSSAGAERPVGQRHSAVAMEDVLTLGTRRCSYLGCTAVEGASEGGLPTKRCAACLAARFHSSQCQAADW